MGGARGEEVRSHLCCCSGHFLQASFSLPREVGMPGKDTEHGQRGPSHQAVFWTFPSRTVGGQLVDPNSSPEALTDEGRAGGERS